jgi:hypothetical protein
MKLYVALLCVALGEIEMIRAAEGPGEVRVWARAFGNAPSEQFFVQSTALPSKQPWHTVSESFPWDIGTLVGQAAEQVTRINGITNKAVLNDIKLRRLVLPTVQGGAPSREQWIIAFAFSFWNTDAVHSVVMLSDGTFVGPTPPARYATNSPRSLPVSGSWLTPASDIRARLRASDFAIPTTQWDPSRESLPLPMGEACSRALEHLLRHGTQSTANYTLCEASLERFMPIVALTKQGLDITANMNHWACILTFERNDDEGRAHPFQVLMLLDGSIIDSNGD